VKADIAQEIPPIVSPEAREAARLEMVVKDKQGEPARLFEGRRRLIVYRLFQDLLSPRQATQAEWKSGLPMFEAKFPR
jgi:hypothetical protein